MSASDSAAGCTGLRALLVEDVLPLASTLSRLLKPAFDVEHATTVAAALAVVDDGRPLAAMIVDVGLPDGSGLDIVDRARRQRLETPACIISGLPALEDLRRAGKDRAVWLCKPDLEEGLIAFARERLVEVAIAERGMRLAVLRDAEACRLSLRKSRILVLALLGLQRKEIAVRLGLPEGTVKHDTHAILDLMNQHRSERGELLLTKLEDYAAELAHGPAEGK
jgi:DNA-binding NarL/FixJ family response regulator